MKPAKHLIEILKKHSGRDSTGSISVRHQGGRHKRYYRIIDFKRDKFDVVGTVLTVEYDPNRNSRISLVEYADGEKDTYFNLKILRLEIRLFHQIIQK